MSVFISPNDYTFLAGSCVKTIHNLCGHNYQLWCLQGNEERINDIIDSIVPTVEKLAVKHSGLSFDKILLMSIVDYLVKYEKNTKNQEKDNSTGTIEVDEDKDTDNNNYVDNNNEEECVMLKKQLQKLQKENEKLQNENDKQKQLYYDNLKKLMGILVDVRGMLLNTKTEDNVVDTDNKTENQKK